MLTNLSRSVGDFLRAGSHFDLDLSAAFLRLAPRLVQASAETACAGCSGFA